MSNCQFRCHMHKFQTVSFEWYVMLMNWIAKECSLFIVWFDWCYINDIYFSKTDVKLPIFFCYLEMARDSAVGRERILVVPTSLALDNTTANQHVAGAQNELNQQILEVSFCSKKLMYWTSISNESAN